MTEAKWLQRFIFLETVAALPGMVGGAIRHLHSLRLMKRDNGWIHTLLEEAENERMHLLTFIQMRQPGPLFRSAVLVAQGVVFNLFFVSYLLSPKTCHRFVGYLEEEAVKTYTHAIADLDAGKLPAWNNMLAPPLAVEYWKLKPGATMRDLLLAVRADEAVRLRLLSRRLHAQSPLTHRFSPPLCLLALQTQCHSVRPSLPMDILPLCAQADVCLPFLCLLQHVNHTLASLSDGAKNPFRKGHTEVPTNFVEPPPGIDMRTGTPSS